MAGPEEAAEALLDTPHRKDRLGTPEFEHADSVAGEMSTIARLKFKRLITVRPEAYHIDVAAYESFQSDSTTGDTDTFDLAHYPMQSPSTPDNAVLYAGGQRVARSNYSVDYDANTLDYSGDETTDDLHAFYLSEQQARVEIRKVAANGTAERLDEFDLSLINAENANANPLAFDWQHALQGVIPAYWELQVRVDAPYPVVWGVDTDGDGEPEATADQMLLDLPINRAAADVPEWVSDVVAGIAGQR